MRKGFVFLLIFILFFYGKTEIKLERVLTITGKGEGELYMWADVAVDPEGNIYVTDNMDCSIKKFDKNGKFLKKTGEKGEGPGEFMAPREIAYYNGYLYVTDQYKSYIQVFDQDLHYKKSIPVKEPVREMEVFQGRIIVSSGSPRAPIIFDVDEKGEKGKFIKLDVEIKDFFRRSVRFKFDREGTMYVIYSFMDRVEKYDSKMRRLWRRSFLGGREVEWKKSKIGIALPTTIIYKSLAVDRYGNVFIAVGGERGKKGKIIYVVKPDGSLLTSLELEESTHCIYIDHNNFLYTRGGMGTALKKYRIRYLTR